MNEALVTGQSCGYTEARSTAEFPSHQTKSMRQTEGRSEVLVKRHVFPQAQSQLSSYATIQVQTHDAWKRKWSQSKSVCVWGPGGGSVLEPNSNKIHTALLILSAGRCNAIKMRDTGRNSKGTQAGWSMLGYCDLGFHEDLFCFVSVLEPESPFWWRVQLFTPSCIRNDCWK